NPVKFQYGTNAPCSPDPTVECYVNQFGPAASWIQTGPQASHHAVAWHDTRRDITTPRGTMWGAWSCSSGRRGTFSSMELANGRGVPWPFTATNGNTPWGDYEGMAAGILTVGGSGTFFPAWG